MAKKIKTKTHWIVRDNNGDVFHFVTDTDDSEQVFIEYAKQVEKLDVTGDFDTGNVDIEIEKLEDSPDGFHQVFTDAGE